MYITGYKILIALKFLIRNVSERLTELIFAYTSAASQNNSLKVTFPNETARRHNALRNRGCN